MLVLSRRIGEEICLPELGVKIKLIKVRGKAARVGIEAPLDISILRGELSEEFCTVAGSGSLQAASV